MSAQSSTGLGVDHQHPGILARLLPARTPQLTPARPTVYPQVLHTEDFLMRPPGVTLIAVWFWLRGALGILLGLSIAVAGGLAGRAMHALSAGTALPGFLAGLGAFLGIAVAGLSVLSAIAGLGVFLMKGWGRILAIALAALSLLFSISVLLHPHPLSFIRPIIDIAIIGYLMLPEVQAQFS
jgi:uncharacterized membrane protein (DUF2068 family)